MVSIVMHCKLYLMYKKGISMFYAVAFVGIVIIITILMKSIPTGDN